MSEKYDSEIYGDREHSDYLPYVADEEDIAVDENEISSNNFTTAVTRRQINAPKELLHVDEEDGDSMEEYKQKYGSGLVNTKISSRESEVSYYCLL